MAFTNASYPDFPTWLIPWDVPLTTRAVRNRPGLTCTSASSLWNSQKLLMLTQRAVG